MICTIDIKKTSHMSLLNYALSVNWNFWSKAEVRKMPKYELAKLIELYMSQKNSDLDEWLEFAKENNLTIKQIILNSMILRATTQVSNRMVIHGR